MHEPLAEDEAISNLSLCTGNCKRHPETGLCVVCYRTREECLGWRQMSIEERREVLALIDMRRAADPDSSTQE
jgi:predicted Fe-S protein YdhL (DUF1289 family)